MSKKSPKSTIPSRDVIESFWKEPSVVQLSAIANDSIKQFYGNLDNQIAAIPELRVGLLDFQRANGVSAETFLVNASLTVPAGTSPPVGLGISSTGSGKHLLMLDLINRPAVRALYPRAMLICAMKTNLQDFLDGKFGSLVVLFPKLIISPNRFD